MKQLYAHIVETPLTRFYMRTEKVARDIAKRDNGRYPGYEPVAVVNLPPYLAEALRGMQS